jgi:hypothetical protein
MKAVAHPLSDVTALEELTGEFLDSYMGDERARRISHRYLPSREAIVEILESVLDLMYPGYFGRRDLSSDNLRAHVAQSVAVLAPKLEREMEHCLCYGREHETERPAEFGECAPRAHELAEIFLGRLPEIRSLLIRDVQAAFDGDPAATNLDEVILAYPGVLAVSVYRIAHALYDLGVPMMARIMTEWAHSKTGADIHPGDLGRAVVSAGCERPDHSRQEAASHRGERLDAVCQCHGARRTDRGRCRQRHRRLGVSDSKRAAALARVAQGAGVARGDTRWRRGA